MTQAVVAALVALEPDAAWLALAAIDAGGAIDASEAATSTRTRWPRSRVRAALVALERAGWLRRGRGRRAELRVGVGAAPVPAADRDAARRADRLRALGWAGCAERGVALLLAALAREQQRRGDTTADPRDTLDALIRAAARAGARNPAGLLRAWIARGDWAGATIPSPPARGVPRAGADPTPARPPHPDPLIRPIATALRAALGAHDYGAWVVPLRVARGDGDVETVHPWGAPPPHVVAAVAEALGVGVRAVCAARTA